MPNTAHRPQQKVPSIIKFLHVMVPLRCGLWRSSFVFEQFITSITNLFEPTCFLWRFDSDSDRTNTAAEQRATIRHINLHITTMAMLRRSQHLMLLLLRSQALAFTNLAPRSFSRHTRLFSSSSSAEEEKWSTNQVRSTFKEYFQEKHDHEFVKSSACAPLNDPTLLFTNAGAFVCYSLL